MLKPKITLFLVCTVIFLISTLVIAQDDDEIEVLPRAGFVAYSCTFQRDTNSVQIRSVIFASNGNTLPRESYQISASVVDTGVVLPTEALTLQPVSQRPPLQLLIVLDITDTVPITQVVNALTEELMPRLLAEDQVALLTFSAEISPRTQFYTDKNRLVNEHMLDLLTLEGDNRLYDALFSAVNDFPLDSDKRQVILLVTDSSRREVEQTSIGAITERANRSNIQIYSVGFYSRDRPNFNELRTLANDTGGYSWLNSDIVNSRATIEAAVRTMLEDFTTTLNNEAVIEVDMRGQRPDPSGNITLSLTLTSSNEEPITEQVVCPIEVLSHSITFPPQLEGGTVVGSVDINAIVESDLNPDEIKVVFRVNDEVVREGPSQVYTFEASTLKPGYYNIGAQLVDNNGELLATTPTTLRFFVRQILQLNVLNQVDLSNLNGETQFEVATNPEFELRAARFDVSLVGSEAPPIPLDNSVVGFDSTGRAVLTVPNIGDTLRRLFPDQPAEARYEVRAVVAGANSAEPDLALSNPVQIGLLPPSEQPAVAVSPEIVVPEAIRAIAPNYNHVPNLLLVGLLLFNILLFRAVRRAGVLRMIFTPDRHELSPQAMCVTVKRDGVKQTHVLTKKTVRIGRGSSNEINLGDDPNISREHGVIMWRKQSWYYANRKARAIARINGRRFIGYRRYKLIPITEIEIGNALLIFHSNAQQDISEFIKTNL